MGNLVEYGILQEQSDIRIHVSVLGRCIYVFETAEAKKEVLLGGHKVVTVKQRGVVTARGVLVPPSTIKGLKKVMVAERLWGKLDLKQTDSPSVKREKSEKLVKYLIERGEVPLPLRSELVTSTEQQLRGIDMVTLSLNIQVKVDYAGGDGEGCSGNLFIQTHECNPDKQY